MIVRAFFRSLWIFFKIKIIFEDQSHTFHFQDAFYQNQENPTQRSWETFEDLGVLFWSSVFFPIAGALFVISLDLFNFFALQKSWCFYDQSWFFQRSISVKLLISQHFLTFSSTYFLSRSKNLFKESNAFKNLKIKITFLSLFRSGPLYFSR